MARQSYPKADNNPPAKRFNSYLVNQDAAVTLRYMTQYLVRLGDYLRRVADVANGAREGKLNCVLDVTWANAATTTTIVDARIGPDSHLSFTPLTANAATIYGDGAWYISARDKGTCTVTHTSAAQSDHNFTMSIIG
jgi:hypothetical protein